MSIIKAQGAGEVSTGFYPYSIGQSLRFNDGDSAYLTRTPSTSNQRTWTWSAWIKRGNISTAQYLFFAYGANSNAGFFRIEFNSTDTLRVRGWSTTYLETSALFRDVSAWYNIVLVSDTTQSQTSATASDSRIRLYVNGEQVTSFSSSSMPSQNTDLPVNNNIVHNLSSSTGYSAGSYFDGYMAEVNLIDGTALTAASFGETVDGIWVPKSSSGLTFGTNGFYLPFDDSSAIGDDESSNTNDFTVVNLVATDVVPDSPANNFAVLNPLDNYNTGATLSEGNLKWTIGVADGASRSTFVMTAGKWYVEFLSNNDYIGVVSGNADITTVNGTQTVFYAQDGTKRVNSSGSAYGASWSDGDIIGIALDLDSGTQTVTFYKNNAAQPALNLTDVGNEGYSVSCASGAGSKNATANFGQDSSFAGAETAQGNADGNGVGDFYYSPPSGFLALCSQNLPDAEIIVGSEHFNTVLYSGNNGSQSVSGVSFSPDFVWLKRRNDANGHKLYDSVRGAGINLNISTGAEAGSANGYFTAFDSDGFSLAGGDNAHNTSGGTYVAWNWLAGTAFSNDASATSVGSIDSAGQVNIKAGFSIIGYTGNATDGATVAHGLSQKIEALIVKRRENAAHWQVVTKDLAADHVLLLSGTNAATDYNNFSGGGIDTLASATFALEEGSSNVNNVNADGETYIAYCFHSVEGYSKVGSYVGNGNANGTYVHTGFRPAWFMVKRTDTTNNWVIYDNKRSPINNVHTQLFADLSNADASAGSALGMDFLSTGLKMRGSGNSYNASGGTYIYLAFAESPFKFANAR